MRNEGGKEGGGGRAAAAGLRGGHRVSFPVFAKNQQFHLQN